MGKFKKRVFGQGLASKQVKNVHAQNRSCMCNPVQSINSCSYMHYMIANCGDPSDIVLDQSSVVIMGYSDTTPSLKGNTVNYTCYPGDLEILTGPNMSTCMENGNWEPDPTNVSCIGEFTSALP